MTDDLLQRARVGDEAALRQIYERHRPRVLRLAYALLGDADEAEDVMQDVLVYALTHLDRFDPDRGQFSTWLHTIALNRCRDRLRRRRFAFRRIAEWVTGWSGASLEHDEAIGQIEEHDLLARALAQLTERQREALVLRAVEGLSLAELGEVLGVPLRTAQARLRAAILAMRQALAVMGDDGQATA